MVTAQEALQGRKGSHHSSCLRALHPNMPRMGISKVKGPSLHKLQGMLQEIPDFGRSALVSVAGLQSQTLPLLSSCPAADKLPSAHPEGWPRCLARGRREVLPFLPCKGLPSHHQLIQPVHEAIVHCSALRMENAMFLQSRLKGEQFKCLETAVLEVTQELPILGLSSPRKPEIEKLLQSIDILGLWK